MRIIVGIILMALLLSLVPPAGSQLSQTSARATVIFSFGNGEEMSYTVLLPPDNTTAIKATELACENLSLYLNYSWSAYGAFVNQIGWEKNDYMGSGYYWHLMVWKNGSYQWESSSVGASSLYLSDGDIVGWIYTVDDAAWSPYNTPKSAPGHYVSWSTPRGNFNNTGVSPGKVYGRDVIWKFRGSSPWGFSSTPVVGNGMIYLADSSALYALNFNGSLIWNASSGAAGGYGIASPVLFGKYVIIGTSDKYLRAFYAFNGTLAWEAYLGEDVTSSPVVDMVKRIPMVFVATFNFGSAGHLYAFYLENGTEAWNLTLMGSNYFGIPAVLEGRLYVPIAGIEDSTYTWNPPYGLQCIAENGTYLWNYTTDDSVRASVVASGERIYFVTTGGNLTALSDDGNLLWRTNIGSSTSAPAVVKDIIYAGNNDGYIYAVKDEGSTATVLWKKQLNGPVQGGVLYASGKVVAVTNTQEGCVYVLSTSGAELWNFTPEPSSYLLSSPVIGDSYLLVASNNGYLYALGNSTSLPEIGEITVSNAFEDSTIRISLQSGKHYQAILFYRNTTGDKYHAVWMKYENGEYVGYIPPQSEGNVEYYITIVNDSGTARTTGLREFTVAPPVPELGILLLAPLAAMLFILRNRVRR